LIGEHINLFSIDVKWEVPEEKRKGGSTSKGRSMPKRGIIFKVREEVQSILMIGF